MKREQAFVIMQVGEKDSVARKRADEVFKYIISPVLEEASIEPYRSDLDLTPGQISPQMLKKLLEADLVVADLTGQNPNVFYELGIVHSFARPVIALADSIRLLPFDAKDERVIELGEYSGSLAVEQAESGKDQLRKVLAIVRAADYRPASPLADVAASRSLDQLAPDNPLAAEMASIKEVVKEIQRDLNALSSALRPPSNSSMRSSSSRSEPLKAPLEGVEWRKSTYSEHFGNIEVAFLGDGVAVRAAGDRQQPVLIFSREEWKKFLDGVAAGEYDLSP